MGNRRLTWCAAVLLVLVGLGGLLAQPTGRKLALLVGINRYDHGNINNLFYAENDAEELGKVLNDAGFSVVIMTRTRGQQESALRPTDANILAQLEKLIQHRTKQDLLLLAFSGHGKQYDDKDSFFCPINTDPTNEKKEGKARHVLSMNEIYQRLAESGAGSKLVLVDACRELSARRRGTADVQAVALKKNLAILFSCSESECSIEKKFDGQGHGLFTYEVLQGLKGAARNIEGEVTWKSLVEHVCRRVPKHDDIVQHPEEVGRFGADAPQVLVGRFGAEPGQIPLVPKPKTGKTAAQSAVDLIGD